MLRRDGKETFGCSVDCICRLIIILDFPLSLSFLYSTFGSPMVGGHAFADSFRHQEKTGKLQYARFINARDSGK